MSAAWGGNPPAIPAPYFQTQAAKRRFVNYYRLLVVAAEAELGEEGARALLLRFSRSATDTEEDDEDVGDDPTVDERGEAPAV